MRYEVVEFAHKNDTWYQIRLVQSVSFLFWRCEKKRWLTEEGIYDPYTVTVMFDSEEKAVEYVEKLKSDFFTTKERIVKEIEEV